MSQTIAVVGASGSQGGSVVQQLLKDKSWKIKGLTRDTTKESAQRLKAKGVEPVAAKFDDEDSLVRAFDGVQAAYSYTNFWEHFKSGKTALESRNIEFEQGKKLANAAAKTPSLKHYIWSSVPYPDELTNGEIPVLHCDSKGMVEKYIRDELPELAKKTTFLWVGYYPSNLFTDAPLKPSYFEPAGRHIWMNPCKGESIVPLGGDISHNVGVYVAAILAHPEITLPTKTTFVHTELISHFETLKIWSEVTGKPAEFVQCTAESLGRLYGKFGAELADQLKWGETTDNWEHLRQCVTKQQLGIKESDLRGTRSVFQKMVEAQ